MQPNLPSDTVMWSGTHLIDGICPAIPLAWCDLARDVEIWRFGLFVPSEGGVTNGNLDVNVTRLGATLNLGMKQQRQSILFWQSSKTQFVYWLFLNRKLHHYLLSVTQLYTMCA